MSVDKQEDEYRAIIREAYNACPLFIENKDSFAIGWMAAEIVCLRKNFKHATSDSCSCHSCNTAKEN